MRIPLIEHSLSSWHDMKAIWMDLLEKTPAHDGTARARISAAIAECDDKIEELQHRLSRAVGVLATSPVIRRAG